MLKYSKIDSCQIRKILRCFSKDLTAKEAASIIGLNIKTINRHYGIFRQQLFLSMIESEGENLQESNSASNYLIFKLSIVDNKITAQKVPNPEPCSHYMLLNGMGAALYYDLIGKRFVLRNYKIRYGKSPIENKKLDEFWDFTKKRLAKFCGLKKENFYLHLKESEFRYNHQESLQKALRKVIKIN